jgi:hypothetical protein
MPTTKCDQHSQEIIEIRTEFHEYRKTTNHRLDEILEKIKPQFTYPQITGFLLVLVGFMASIMLYASDVKSDTRNNSTKIHAIEDGVSKKMFLYENIDLKLEKLLTDVAVLKSQSE